MNESALAGAITQLNLDVPPTALGPLAAYCELLWEWNQRMNLTRHDTYEKFVSRDLVDSLQLAACLEAGEEVLDVGSGGGVPGIVVAILRPDIEVSLCESTGKKAMALDDMVQRLKIPVPVYHDRAETVLEDLRFSTVMARAVGPIDKMLGWFQNHWDSIGRLLLIKGPKWVEERGTARHLGLLRDLDLRRLASYPMHGTSSESVILSIAPKQN
ncbi:MAG: 16S rRNA (guanine(527)-N(7))-methyltransferase RsmG [Planctomycetales bacterium]|nr:16S rRNA (guanine(527)-N(7))-methyltransferase RsmG [Planctomycetales bacterium]